MHDEEHRTLLQTLSERKKKDRRRKHGQDEEAERPVKNAQEDGRRRKLHEVRRSCRSSDAYGLSWGTKFKKTRSIVSDHSQSGKSPPTFRT